jgi:DNA-binding transcriptional regulator YhcF (GntR family)
MDMSGRNPRPDKAERSTGDLQIHCRQIAAAAEFIGLQHRQPAAGRKALAQEFGVARMTIRKALDLLVSWGLVERRHGSGTFVRAKTSTMKPPT